MVFPCASRIFSTTDMTQSEIDEVLYSAADEKYREFNARIIRTNLPMIGVRTPLLKSLAKKIAKEGGDFLDSYKAENYEQVLLYSLVLAYAKMPLDNKYPYLDAIMRKYDNWGVVDMTVAAFTQAGREREKFLKDYIHLESAPEFERRFLAVFLLDYCITEDMIGYTLEAYKRIQNDEYYVNMAVAWGLSVALVKFYDRTVEYMQCGGFSDFIIRKAVQKARESYRISEEKKNELTYFFVKK